MKKKIDVVVKIIVEQRERIMRKAFDHFDVRDDEISERVSLRVIDGKELIFIDDTLAVTFPPITMGPNQDVVMAFDEHYLVKTIKN